MERALSHIRAKFLPAVGVGETILAEGPVIDPSMEMARAYLFVTAEAFVMGYIERPDLVMRVPFEKVFAMAERPDAVVLTTRGWGTPLVPDPLNLDDEADFFIIYGGQNHLRVALEDGVRRLSPEWDTWRRGIERFRALRNRPVNTWERCPMCETRFDRRTEHASRCGSCGRYFSDGKFRPDVSEEAESYGELKGTVPWALLETELKTASDAMGWILKPREYADQPMPIVVQDPEIERYGHTRC
jgi:hypothetical protein